MALEDHSHIVYVTRDGKSCLETYRRMHEMDNYTTRARGPFFDVVILDYRMPKKDGLKVAREILDIDPYQKILIVTAYSRELVDTSGKLKNAGLLIKPVMPEDVLKAVESLQKMRHTNA